MKTIRKLLLLCLFGMISMRAWAYDFKVNGIYYSITNSTNKTVSVTYETEHTGWYGYEEYPPEGVYFETEAYDDDTKWRWCESDYFGTVYIPSSVYYDGHTYQVASISENAFANCSKVTSIDIPSSIISIGKGAFGKCSAQKINISDLTSWLNITFENEKSNPLCNGGSLFYNGNWLTNITVPSSIHKIKNYAFDGCMGLTSITLPNTVESIGWSAFDGCKNLQYIELPSSLIEIGLQSFQNCSGLKSLVIPSSVLSICHRAFYGCSGLTSITIPSSVTSIELQAFMNCRGLTDIYVNWQTPLWIDSEAFYRTNQSSITLHVPYGTKSLYESAWGWKDLGTIVEMEPEDILCTSIELIKPTAELKIGETLTLTATVLPETATDNTVTWTSSNESVATVANGLVTAVAAGKATITAKTNDGSNLAAICEVTVISGGATSGIEPSTDITTLANTLYFNDTEHRAGDFELALNMKNAEENITAFQCDVYLPAGVNWASTIDKRGNAVLTQPVFNTTTERTDASYHTISPVTQMTDGSYRIIVYSMGKETILDLDGAVLDLPLTVSADMEAGEYNIFIKNIVMTDVNTEQTLVEKVVSKLTIPSFTPGDVNDDKMINVTDVVAVVSYMLEDVPSPFIFKAADINNDETINVTDIVGIIDIINSPAPAKKAPKRMVKKSAKSEYSLEVVPFAVATGTTSKTATLDLINPEEDITAFQCDIYLPEGIDWASTTDRRGNITYTQPTFNKAADRTDDTYHTISPITKMTDGSFRIIVYSMKKEVFLDNAGAVIDLPLVFDADLAAGVYDVKVGNMVLTKTDVTQELPDDYTFSVLVGSPEIASATLHGDYTVDAISELNTALASNTVLSAIDFTEATSVDASTKIETGNKNLLVYVSEGTDVANSQNVVEGDECESLVLTDGYNFAAPKAFTAVSASYGRTAPSTYGTTVLPFVPSTSGAEFYELTGVTPTCFEFQKVVSPVAGTPYLYRATTDNFTATNAEIATTEAGKVTASGWTMQGTYTKEVFDASDNVYAVSDDKVYCNIGTLTMNPFRAYFTGNTSSAPMNISIDGTTVIGSIENGELAIDGAAFNLAGQKVSKSYKGIVITNGKKEIRK